MLRRFLYLNTPELSWPSKAATLYQATFTKPVLVHGLVHTRVCGASVVAPSPHC